MNRSRFLKINGRDMRADRRGVLGFPPLGNPFIGEK
jgi:hypothetical protein